MHYIIGIDGGGTKTKLTLCDLEGKVLSTYVAGPSNILSSGYETAKASLNTLFRSVIEEGYTLEACEGLCIGAAGAGRDHIKTQIEQMIRALGYNGKLIITHDAETALVGGTGGSGGILIIAGTGAICYGQDEEGKTHRVSGWGHIVGDEGSAYYIGVKIIDAVMRAYDGRGNQTLLTTSLLETMGIGGEEEIIKVIYQLHMTKKEIAEYAILIDKACKAGDKVALSIADQVIYELVEDVLAVERQLDFKAEKVDVVINGSVLVSNDYIREGFKARLHKEKTKLHVRTMKYDASYGAALIALKNL